jgi:hypothetical protein
MVTIFGSTVTARTGISLLRHLKESALKKFFQRAFKRNCTKEVLLAISGRRPRLNIFLVVIPSFILFSRVPPIRRERRVRGKEWNVEGNKVHVRGVVGCAAVHPDARSNGRSVVSGVHVRVGARRTEAGYASIKTHASRRLGAGHAE